MAFFDLSLDQLKTYCPERQEPQDFDAFWAETLAAARQHPLNAVFTPVAPELRTVDTYDVTFNGYGGQPVKGWLQLPHGASGPLPCVVEFIGYGGGRGYPVQWLTMASAGFAHFIMDTRGQGSNWQTGDTPDPEPDGANPFYPGFMTRGVLSPQTYYYRRVFTDAARAVEAASGHPAVDATRLAATGGSQGGGITLAAAGLCPQLKAVLPDVPFLCHYRRATQVTNGFPYGEIVAFCKIHRDKIEQVFDTLSYFDGVNFAARAQAKALFSTAQMDDICPPSTVFAAYNHYAGPKSIEVYEFNQHEGGGVHHQMKKIRFLQELFG